jgi:protein-tyrosine phosphatase
MSVSSASLLPATFNARDLGGLEAVDGIVRRGVVLRSDAPVALDAQSRSVLRRIGARTAIDLREPVERELDPPDLGGLGIEVISEPILGNFELGESVTLEDVYRAILTTRGVHLVAAIRRIAAPKGLPAIVFCSAGKDRTGLVVALLLGAVGVRDEEIVADFHQTELNMQGPFRDAIVARAVAAGITDQEMAAKVGAPSALMQTMLDWLRESHGGAAGYLKHHGLTDEELQILRDQLIAPVAEARRATG